MPATEFVVLALDARDAEDWRAEHPELAYNCRIIIANGFGWRALAGLIPSAISLAPRAAADPSIGGAEPPRNIRLALAVADRHRARELGVVDDGR